MTIFLGCGFAAKYRDGGGNFSVPLQWMLGLRRLKLNAIWLELLPSEGSVRQDQDKIDNFQRQLRKHNLAGHYCLLYQNPANDAHDLETIRCVGLSKRKLLERLAGPNTLLNLSYSIHPPLLLKFERRIFCDLDPSEIFYWMTKMEVGQSTHHEFWTIGLNLHGADCGLPEPVVADVPAAPFRSHAGDTPASTEDRRQTTRPPIRQSDESVPRRTGRSRSVTSPRRRKLHWKTFYPLVDTQLVRTQPRPRNPKFTTIGQWYWNGSVEVDGKFPDLSKKFAFEKYLHLPGQLSKAHFELAMNINADDPERSRLRKRGWRIVDPHHVARTPGKYRRYIASALAEFTAIKGVDVAWQTGWLSDRAASFLATGRPVITEDTGAAKYLPRESGFHFVNGATEAEEAMREVLADWPRQSKRARRCAVQVFDSTKNLRKILG